MSVRRQRQIAPFSLYHTDEVLHLWNLNSTKELLQVRGQKDTDIFAFSRFVRGRMRIHLLCFYGDEVV
jgi:hypothetical protein